MVPERLDSVKSFRKDDVVSATERLLEVATELIAEKGPDGFTLREAARRAGVSHATPGFLFGDLRGLITEVAVGGFTRFAEAMEQAERLDLPVLNRLLAVGEAYVAFARREPHVFRLMMSDVNLDRSNPAFEAVNGRSFGPLYRQMQLLYDVHTDTPEFIARVTLAWSTVHGLARLILDGPLRDQFNDDAKLPSIIGALGPSLLAPLN
jgi:AcrR family transcriptional regulator